MAVGGCQMKPGDLVFAEGKYVKEGVKPQKGDIVHVEVFLGGGPEGKSVCGARWNKGVVQEFDSYSFAPKSWTLTKWHFCSIDTWLQGTCRSWHPEREWKRRDWLPGKNSIFSGDVDEGQEEDENAGPGEDDGDDPGAQVCVRVCACVCMCMRVCECVVRVCLCCRCCRGLGSCSRS